uniref:Maturase K n=1 Tax=Romanomermis culicivorax TaxID=13658 RepID=A0A915I4U2_ROMCU
MGTKVGESEKGRREFDQPFWIGSANLKSSHSDVFLRENARLRRFLPSNEFRKELDLKLFLNFTYFPHIFLGSHDQLVIHDPFRLIIEQRAGGVNVNGLAIDQRSITLLRIFFSGVPEKSRTYGFLDFLHLSTTRNNI